MTTQTIERSTQSTCSTCPYFQDFGETNGRGFCQLFDKMARRHHFRTGDCDQQIETVESAQQPAPSPTPQPKQPGGFSGDSTGCKLRPTFEGPQQLEKEPQAASKLEAEFEQGRIHFRNDALAGWHPIYKEPVTEYARGYLAGHNAVLKPTDQQQVARKPLEWSLTWNQRWGWYDVWVSDRWIGRAATEESAERMARERIAMDEMIRRQNAAIMAAYAASSRKAAIRNTHIRN